MFNVPGASEFEKQQEEELVRQVFQSSEPEANIDLRKLHVSHVVISRNTLSKVTGSGIKLDRVKARNLEKSQSKERLHALRVNFDQIAG